jgi:hypothetical protein
MRTGSHQASSGGLPAADPQRFCKLERDDVVGLSLAGVNAPDTRFKLDRQLKALMSSAEVKSALIALECRGLVRNAVTNPSLTAKGSNQYKSMRGGDLKQPWKTVVDQRLVAKSLGVDPDDKSQRKAIADARALPAMIVGVAFGLPAGVRSAAEVRSELLWRVFRSRLSDVIGNGPFLVEPNLDRHSRAVLLGLVSLKSGSVQQATAVLAARCVGLEKADAGELRMGLVRQALRLRPEPIPRRSFAQNVLDVAGELATPPFDGRVAIAQIYDAYGRRHADAGSLTEFKRRLVEAARSREISLQRVDMPELMARDLRERSQTQWDGDVVHLVVVEWR